MVIVDIIADVVASMKVPFTITHMSPTTGGFIITVDRDFPLYNLGKYVTFTTVDGSSELLCDAIDGNAIRVQSKAGEYNTPVSVTPTAPMFLHGHPRDIVAQLQELVHNEKRFPLIAMFEPFEETVSTDSYVEAKLDFVICNLTKPDYHSPQRYDFNMRPVLLPLKDLFIEALKSYVKPLNYKKQLSFTAINQTYWGKQGLYGSEGNIFNDHIDAIELKNVDLLFTSENCISYGKLA